MKGEYLALKKLYKSSLEDLESARQRIAKLEKVKMTQDVVNRFKQVYEKYQNGQKQIKELTEQINKLKQEHIESIPNKPIINKTSDSLFSPKRPLKRQRESDDKENINTNKLLSPKLEKHQDKKINTNKVTTRLTLPDDCVEETEKCHTQ